MSDNASSATTVGATVAQLVFYATTMKRNPIQAYALTVCFASLLAGSISLAVGIYDIIQISFPEATNTTYRAQLEAVQTRQLLLNGRRQVDVAAGAESSAIGGSNLVVATPAIAAPNSGFYVNQAIQSLIFSSIVLIICAGVFYFHWGLAKLRT